MFAKDRVTYINGSSIKTVRDGGTKVTANTLGGGGSGGFTSAMAYGGGQFNY